MRTSKYSEEQIISFLEQAEAGLPIKGGRLHFIYPPLAYTVCRWNSSRRQRSRARCRRC